MEYIGIALTHEANEYMVCWSVPFVLVMSYADELQWMVSRLAKCSLGFDAAPHDPLKLM